MIQLLIQCKQHKIRAFWNETNYNRCRCENPSETNMFCCEKFVASMEIEEFPSALPCHDREICRSIWRFSSNSPRTSMTIDPALSPSLKLCCCTYGDLQNSAALHLRSTQCLASKVNHVIHMPPDVIVMLSLCTLFSTFIALKYLIITPAPFVR